MTKIKTPRNPSEGPWIASDDVKQFLEFTESQGCETRNHAGLLSNGELVVKKSKKFYPELPCQKYLLNLWKNEMVPEVNTWKELSDFLKNSKVKYRVPLPEEGSFRIFQSNRSLVLFV